MIQRQYNHKKWHFELFAAILWKSWDVLPSINIMFDSEGIYITFRFLFMCLILSVEDSEKLKAWEEELDKQFNSLK